ncbi:MULTISPECIES: EAL domain-containing protein [unclassified Legionella]|uniref:EAL domain-containing protein n=1 Tax=unclassified Legionella TaxID=2622702 RepID=UPI00105524A1|nr:MULTISPECIES: EAL domain-containing protein [unclassified Legionella]MDI9819230.1 EAL domain-containing protein [Legionella sp. PL877]
MNEIELRIIVIDDNPSIFQDFIKVLTTTRTSQEFDKLDEQLFGEENDISPHEEILLPKFTIDTASQGREGVEKIKKGLKQGSPYALAFVDIRMPPGWDGLETIQHIWKIDKDIQVVICTAYSDYTWEETIRKLGMSDNLLVLKKPFDKVAVRQLACALTRKWLLAREAKSHTESLKRIVAERTESLNQSLSLLRATIESSTDGILVVDLKRKIVDYNKQFTRMWGIPPPMLELKNENLLLEYMIDKIQNSQDFLNQINYLHKNIDESSLDVIKFKKETIIECYSQPHRINTVTVGRVWSFRDITERAVLEQQLEHQATHDSLTGLPNRVLLNERIQHAIDSATYRKNHFAILFLDVDRFKLVNDSLGHEVGDTVLCEVARRLSALLRTEDTLARIGGDEFVMVIPGLKKIDHIVTVAQKILNSFNEPITLAHQEFILTTSVGISIYPSNGRTITTLLKNADLAMYQAKEQGRNQFKLYTPRLNQKTNKQLKQESELRRALANNDFFLLYQPQFDLETHSLLGVEALIRWQHPKKGMILPLDFIPAAEESGLIVPIGEWVIREACNQIVTWHKNGLPYVKIAVNVATKQLKQANFAETVKNILQEYEVSPDYLELEITENVIITNTEVQKMIRRLKQIGIKIALDDFGTGNSSLNYLKTIQVDRLKIDESFIRNISHSHTDEIIIEAIIAMGRSFNFKVLAEGVENKKQIKFLKSRHCDELQGFFFSKPLSAEIIANIIRETDIAKK